MAREIVFLALFVFAILSLLSLFQMCGVFGKGLSALLFGLLGALAYVFPVYLVVTAGLYLANAKNQRLRHKVWYSAGIYWSVCGLFMGSLYGWFLKSLWWWVLRWNFIF